MHAKHALLFPSNYIWCPVRSDQPQSVSAEGLHIVCYDPRSHCSGVQLSNRNRLTVPDQQAGMPDSRQLAGARSNSVVVEVDLVLEGS